MERRIRFLVTALGTVAAGTIVSELRKYIKDCYIWKTFPVENFV